MREVAGFCMVCPMSLGMGEWVVLAVVVVVIFSASRMGSLGNALGKFVYSFKRAASGKDVIDVTPRAQGRLPRPGPEDAEWVEPGTKKKKGR